MKKFFKKAVAAALSVILCGYTAISASAKEPYDVYNYDRWGEPIPSQAGYTAERAVSGGSVLHRPYAGTPRTDGAGQEHLLLLPGT